MHDSNRNSPQNHLYRTWQSIKDKCLKPSARDYKYCGARGISVYTPWINDYELFKAWILANIGDRPKGMTLDREDNDGNYKPGNLRWATVSTQNSNRRAMGSSNEKHIRQVGDKWKVFYEGKHYGYFNSIAEAIIKRDEVLNEHNP